MTETKHLRGGTSSLNDNTMSGHSIDIIHAIEQKKLAMERAASLLKHRVAMKKNEVIEVAEDRLVAKICSEIEKLKESWDVNNTCDCKYTERTKFTELQAECNKIKQECLRTEEQKLILMNRVKELEVKLNQEKEFRLQLSGMLSIDNTNEDKSTKGRGCHQEVIDVGFTDDSDDAKTIECETVSSSSVRSDKRASSSDRKPSKKRKKESDEGSRQTQKSKRSSSKTSESLIKTQHGTSLVIRRPEVIPLKELADEIEERNNRKNNIVLKGFQVQDRQNIGPDLMNLIAKVTGVIPNMKRLSELEPGTFLLELTSANDKTLIMKRRESLKKSGIRLRNDLTDREIQVQRWLEDLARQDEKMGKRTKVEYMKIQRNGKWEVWNEHLGQLVLDRPTGSSPERHR